MLPSNLSLWILDKFFLREDIKRRISHKPDFRTRMCQWFIERGIKLPWHFSQEICQFYWSHTANQHQGNRPVDYVNKKTEIVDFMVKFWERWVKKTDLILELGCNAGANLLHLRKLGYTKLVGIELNPSAVEEASKNALAVSEVSIEDCLGFINSKVDVIFTMAVLLHIHPTSTDVFKNMTRVAKYICVIESESFHNSYVFPRNYRRVFEKLGCEQLASTPVFIPGYYGYTARIFKTNNRP